jgi:hypothetical protein
MANYNPNTKGLIPGANPNAGRKEIGVKAVSFKLEPHQIAWLRANGKARKPKGSSALLRDLIDYAISNSKSIDII